MRPGRKPKPTHIKLVEGRPGHRALNQDEPQPDAVDEGLKPPAWLSGEARTKWEEDFPLLVRNGMITDVDVNAFARYCQAYGRMIVAESMVAKQGEVLIAPSGFPVQNPYLAVANKAAEQMHKAETEFGMTPSSRSRVSKTPPKKKTNRFLDLVDGSKKRRA